MADTITRAEHDTTGILCLYARNYVVAIKINIYLDEDGAIQIKNTQTVAKI